VWEKIMVWERTPSPDDLICPACLTVYQHGEISPDRPTRPERNLQAADIDVIPYRRFLAESSLDNLESRTDRAASRDDLLPGFMKHLIRHNVDAHQGENRMPPGDPQGAGR
jgi:hypothetical protein